MAAAGTTTRRMRNPGSRKLTEAITRASELVNNAATNVAENKGTWLRRAMVLLIAVLVLSAAWSSIKDFLQAENITRIVEDLGLFGPILLGLIQILQVIVAVIPGDFLIVVAGRVYGFAGGFWINMVSTLIACFAAFFIARWAGRKVVERMVPAQVLDKWMKVVDEKGSAFFVISFLVPVFPADAMNFVAGLSQISPKKFLLVSVVGRMPKIFLMTLISSGLELSPTVWLVMATALLVGLMVYSMYRSKKRRTSSAHYSEEKEFVMNEKDRGLDNQGPQQVERSEAAVRAAGAVLVLLISIALLLGSRAGNMALSLVWPLLLLPMLSALKALCVLLCRSGQVSTENAHRS